MYQNFVNIISWRKRMKIIKVKCCNNCPLLRWNWESDTCVRKDNKKIKDIDTIPKWCPLEDYNANNHR